MDDPLGLGGVVWRIVPARTVSMYLGETRHHRRNRHNAREDEALDGGLGTALTPFMVLPPSRVVTLRQRCFRKPRVRVANTGGCDRSVGWGVDRLEPPLDDPLGLGGVVWRIVPARTVSMYLGETRHHRRNRHNAREDEALMAVWARH